MTIKEEEEVVDGDWSLKEKRRGQQTTPNERVLVLGAKREKERGRRGCVRCMRRSVDRLPSSTSHL